MCFKLSDVFENMNEEELEDFIKDSAKEIFGEMIEELEKEEAYKEIYLNKYEVYKLIKYLADSSEPMVSSPTYDYYEINADLLLQEISDME